MQNYVMYLSAAYLLGLFVLFFFIALTLKARKKINLTLKLIEVKDQQIEK